MEGDVILMLDGAHMPMIVRSRTGTVVRIVSDISPPEKISVLPGSELISVSLVWDWAPAAGF